MKVHPSTAKSWARRFYEGMSVDAILCSIPNTCKWHDTPYYEKRAMIEQAIRDYPPKYRTFGESERKTR